MKVEEVRLLGLIGLRALAEYDPSEYKRSSDMSRGQLDARIRGLLEEVDSPECAELYRNLTDIISSFESPLELSFLLRQIYISGIGKAQYYSLQLSRAEQMHDYERSIEGKPRSSSEMVHHGTVSEGDELVRLSTMLMLKDLRDYTYAFHRYLGDMEIDCVLEPEAPNLPYILLEAKPGPGNWLLESKVETLKKAIASFPGRALGVIVTEAPVEGRETETTGENIYLLSFDVRSNQFLGKGFKRLLERLERQSHDLPKE